MRGKLGESLSSIQKFDVQFERTTSSLEALREYALGRAEVSKGQFRQAIEHQWRAVEIDPNFASAWTALATMYNDTNEPGLAAECAAKAFALRDRVSEYEKARITVFYYLYVTGELEQMIEAQQAFIQNYPRDYTGPGNLADFYHRTGQFKPAVTAAREALRLNPNSANLHKNPAEFLLNFNRFAEAKEVCAGALSQNLDSFDIRGLLYTFAFVSGDTAAQQEQLTWAGGKPDEYQAVYWQAQQATFLGAWRESQELARRATALAVRHDAPEAGAQYLADAALHAAVLGQAVQVAGLADAALRLVRNKYVLVRAALALALAGQAVQAQLLVRELEQQYPKDTFVTQLWLPTINATFALQKGETQTAIQLLAAAQRYELAGEFWPQTMRAQAYLKLKQGAQAAAAYQQILDQRGQAPLSALYPRATLGLARAAALQGAAAKSRRAYQDFLTLWKEADAALPVLIEAQRELAQR
ncbi:MAG: hypothetical protein HYR56_06600 [Acidobacteria bacterium]|nr:hypothetical protein [Acidobacteriota bacterium]MBI3426693.1 hypothetical protein [Acidobacteriota bacterium]